MAMPTKPTPLTSNKIKEKLPLNPYWYASPILNLETV